MVGMLFFCQKIRKVVHFVQNSVYIKTSYSYKILQFFSILRPQISVWLKNLKFEFYLTGKTRWQISLKDVVTSAYLNITMSLYTNAIKNSQILQLNQNLATHKFKTKWSICLIFGQMKALHVFWNNYFDIHLIQNSIELQQQLKIA